MPMHWIPALVEADLSRVEFIVLLEVHLVLYWASAHWHRRLIILLPAVFLTSEPAAVVAGIWASGSARRRRATPSD